MNRILKLAIIALIGCSILMTESCNTRKKDCRGRRKTAKTNMGGWL
ncbi:MAG: hypothetical protein ACJ76F_02825 [Bacteroidia bacterium]